MLLTQAEAADNSLLSSPGVRVTTESHRMSYQGAEGTLGEKRVPWNWGTASAPQLRSKDRSMPRMRYIRHQLQIAPGPCSCWEMVFTALIPTSKGGATWDLGWSDITPLILSPMREPQ